MPFCSVVPASALAAGSAHVLEDQRGLEREERERVVEREHEPRLAGVAVVCDIHTNTVSRDLRTSEHWLRVQRCTRG